MIDVYYLEIGQETFHTSIYALTDLLKPYLLCSRGKPRRRGLVRRPDRPSSSSVASGVLAAPAVLRGAATTVSVVALGEDTSAAATKVPAAAASANASIAANQMPEIG